jgi:hypothetical protein
MHHGWIDVVSLSNRRAYTEPNSAQEPRSAYLDSLTLAQMCSSALIVKCDPTIVFMPDTARTLDDTIIYIDSQIQRHWTFIGFRP